MWNTWRDQQKLKLFVLFILPFSENVYISFTFTLHILTLFSMVGGGRGKGGQKRPNQLTFLPHWCKFSRLYIVSVPNYWIEPRPPLKKKRLVWSNSYKIEDLQYNLSHVLKFCLWRHGEKLWCHELYLKNLYLKKT